MEVVRPTYRPTETAQMARTCYHSSHPGGELAGLKAYFVHPEPDLLVVLVQSTFADGNLTAWEFVLVLHSVPHDDTFVDVTLDTEQVQTLQDVVRSKFCQKDVQLRFHSKVLGIYRTEDLCIN